MESQTLTEVRYYHYVAILLMVFVGIGFEVGSCESTSDPSNSNINGSYSLKKYLMMSYFDKHEILLDSAFQNFTADEVRPGLCEGLPDNLNLFIRQSVLQRHLIGEGSHRRLASSIKFRIDAESVSRLPIKSCEVLIIERLPSGVFADPFELQHLHQRGVFTDIAVFGDTNLELPSFLSNRSVVEIHLNVGSNILLSQENGLEIKVELPLHARYPPLNDSGYSTVEFGNPDIFMSCNIEGKTHNQNCLFMPTSDLAEAKLDPVVWMIPAGINKHYKLVSAITFITAFLATRSVIMEAFFSSGLY